MMVKASHRCQRGREGGVPTGSACSDCSCSTSSSMYEMSITPGTLGEEREGELRDADRVFPVHHVPASRQLDERRGRKRGDYLLGTLAGEQLAVLGTHDQDGAVDVCAHRPLLVCRRVGATEEFEVGHVAGPEVAIVALDELASLEHQTRRDVLVGKAPRHSRRSPVDPTGTAA